MWTLILMFCVVTLVTSATNIFYQALATTTHTAYQTSITTTSSRDSTVPPDTPVASPHWLWVRGAWTCDGFYDRDGSRFVQGGAGGCVVGRVEQGWKMWREGEEVSYHAPCPTPCSAPPTSSWQSRTGQPTLLLVLALWGGNGWATELLVQEAGQCSATYRRLGRDVAGSQVYQVSFVVSSVRLRQR